MPGPQFGCHPGDAYIQLLAKLPVNWRERIEAEERGQNSGRPWVRFRRILDFSRIEVEEFLASRLGGVPLCVKESGGHYLVQVDSEESQLTLLRLHGKTVGGEPWWSPVIGPP